MTPEYEPQVSDLAREAAEGELHAHHEWVFNHARRYTKGLCVQIAIDKAVKEALKQQTPINPQDPSACTRTRGVK